MTKNSKPNKNDQKCKFTSWKLQASLARLSASLIAQLPQKKIDVSYYSSDVKNGQAFEVGGELVERPVQSGTQKEEADVYRQQCNEVCLLACVCYMWFNCMACGMLYCPPPPFCISYAPPWPVFGVITRRLCIELREEKEVLLQIYSYTMRPIKGL